jgi:hypothetical protein
MKCFSWRRWLNNSVRTRAAARRTATTLPEIEVLEDRSVPSVYTVTGVGDGAGVVAPVQGKPGMFTATTLRAAINAANTNPGTDTIDFAIGAGEQTITITANSFLPAITDSVILDGSAPKNLPTQRIVLDGVNAKAGADGLKIEAGSSTVKGLTIVDFKGPGIELVNKGKDLIVGNLIGTNSANLFGKGNRTGIFINNTQENTIGGVTNDARNVISGNLGNGIRILGTPPRPGVRALKLKNLIQGNYIGTTTDGLGFLGNSGAGIRLESAEGNTIGGIVANAGNVITGNKIGIEFTNRVLGGNLVGSDFNVVAGNFIGTNKNGTDRLKVTIPFIGTFFVSNATSGIVDRSGGNTIGGAVAAARNVISGNKENGILMQNDGAPGDNILGNYIGTKANGTEALANGANGILVDDAGFNHIGAANTAAPNVISGNTENGIKIEGQNAKNNEVQENIIGLNKSGDGKLQAKDSSGKQILVGNGNDGVQIRSDATANMISGGNVISGNASSGVDILFTTGNFVGGNLIGTDKTGQIIDPDGKPNSGDELGNTYGVRIFSSSEVTVGAPGADFRNVISGNKSYGISSDGKENTFRNNYVGTNKDGTKALPNFTGIQISDISSTIGGVNAGEGNLFSGNTQTGITISGRGVMGNSNKILVQGNLVGTNAAGDGAVSNGRFGIRLDDSSDNTIGGGNLVAGGAFPGGNVISGNMNDGIFVGLFLGRNQQAPTGNVIQNNFIGLDKTGTKALTFKNEKGQTLSGNNGNGITIEDAASTTVQNNVISGNTGNGILITGNKSTKNQVLANKIGTDKDGDTTQGKGIPNKGDGVHISKGPKGNTIKKSLITFNGGNGVNELGTGDNTIDPNLIFDNGGIGIQLTPQGEMLHVTPQLTSAISFAGGTTIRGSVVNLPNTTYLIEFFEDDDCDKDGISFLQSTLVTTDGSGRADFVLTLSSALPAGTDITATSTDENSGTSEYSDCVDVQTQTTPQQTAVEGQPTDFTLATFSTGELKQLTASGPATVTVVWDPSHVSSGNRLGRPTTLTTQLTQSGSGFAVNGDPSITISQDNTGQWTLTWNNAFQEEGEFPVTVAIVPANPDSPLRPSFQGAFLAEVSDPVLQPQGMTVSATQGQQFSGAVATFVDPDLLSHISDYSVTIHWGDGSTSGGSVQTDGVNALGQPRYVVLGTHTYSSSGEESISITITHGTPAIVATVNSTAEVAAASGNSIGGVAASMAALDTFFATKSLG